MADLDLDARLDELFASEPKDFTATRDALVRDLKAADRAEEAAEVKALRKPTVAVAAVNRVARTHADQVAALVEIGAELAALQADARPDRDELRDLTRQRRTLLQQLTEHAAATTERPDGARSSITATLDTASLDDALRAELLRGRLTQELAPATRFVLGDDAPSAPRPATRATKRTAPPRDELAARRARAELEAAQERVDDAEESPASTPRPPPKRPSASTPRTVTSPTSRPPWPTPAPNSPSSSAPSATRNVPRVARRTERDRATSALHAAERAVDGSAER